MPISPEGAHADDAATAGTFNEIRAHLARLKELGLRYGYFPEPSKCILVVPSQWIDRTDNMFSDLKFTVVPGSRYLGGFIGEQQALTPWIENKVSKWARDVDTLADLKSLSR